MIIIVIQIIPNESGLALDQFFIGPLRGDYLLHTLIFLPYMVLVWLHLHKENITGVTRYNYALLWLLGGVLFAAFVEGLQYFLPYRSFNPVDLFLNVSGVIVGSVIFLWEPKRYAKLK